MTKLMHMAHMGGGVEEHLEELDVDGRVMLQWLLL
jgi:hypothetical protein